MKSDRKSLIFYCVLSVLVLIWAWQILPPRFKRQIPLNHYIHKTFQFVGFWQSWNMFSPNPTKEDVTMYAEVRYQNEEIKTWHPIRMSELELSEKYLRERWRKWGMDNIRGDNHKNLWPDLGRYIASRMETDSANPVIEVRVYRTWYRIPEVREQFIKRSDISKLPRQSFLFYTYYPQTPANSIDHTEAGR